MNRLFLKEGHLHDFIDLIPYKDYILRILVVCFTFEIDIKLYYLYMNDINKEPPHTGLYIYVTYTSIMTYI